MTNNARSKTAEAVVIQSIFHHPINRLAMAPGSRNVQVAVFSCSGATEDDLWLVDGSPVFTTIPAGMVPDHALPGIASDTPIPVWLKVGTAAYGVTHIRKHWHWVKENAKFVPGYAYGRAPIPLAAQDEHIARLVHMKLGQTGFVYCTENDRKIKLALSFKPGALLILQLNTRQEIHFSVTSIYRLPNVLDGEKVGSYAGRPAVPRVQVPHNEALEPTPVS